MSIKHENTPGLDKVNVSLLEQPQAKPRTGGGGTLPLIIKPRWDSSHSFLCRFINTNRPWIESQILKHGAVLFRGFDVDNASDFEEAMLAVQPDLCDAYRGTSPRSLQDPTKFVFSAADVPCNYPIAQHLEMSFLKAPPRQLYFGCVKASSKPGGETSLCDFRKVYRDLPEPLRKKFQQKKVQYTRRHFKVGERFTYDVGAMLSWPQLFGTSDKNEVEAIVKEEGSPDIQWDDDTFVQIWTDDAFQCHPVTGEQVWFNHCQVFHWTTFPAELWFAFCRIKDLKLLLHFVMVGLFCLIKYGILGYEMALETKFGDGSRITMKEMSAIRTAIHSNMVFSRWAKGDLLCIDNFSNSHGRQPTYDSGRKVVVAWSKPLDKRAKLAKVTKILDVDSHQVLHKKFDVSEVPGIIPITPDDSPASTLTGPEAEQLKQMNALLEKKLTEALRQRKPINSLERRQKSCPVIFGADFWKEIDAS